MFDKMRPLNQATIFDNRHLDVALALARTIEQARPHHVKRNNNGPARTAQPAGVFKVPSLSSSGPKLNLHSLGNHRLKCGSRFSIEELLARCLGEFAC